MFTISFREMLPEVVVMELDQLIMQIVAYLVVQHNEDGTHGNITADSLVVHGTSTFEGPVTDESDASIGTDLFVGLRSFLGWTREEANEDLPGELGGIFSSPGLVVTKGWNALFAADRVPNAGVGELTISGSVTLRTQSDTGHPGLYYEPYRVCVITSATSTPHIEFINPPESDTTGYRFLLQNQTSVPVQIGAGGGGPNAIITPDFQPFWLFPQQAVWLNWVPVVAPWWRIEAPPAVGVWRPYDVTWTAATTNPANPALLQGFYMVIGKTVFVKGSINMGAGTTYGSGVWFISLPIAPKNLSNDTVLCGETFLFDSGTNFRVGVCTIRTTTAPLALQTIFDSSSNVSSATVPITWANGDRLTWSGSYEIA